MATKVEEQKRSTEGKVRFEPVRDLNQLRVSATTVLWSR